ncbi:unnamed protein product [Gordionus sp. m RMFG-2023]|uniref:uncharacterized protein LOC135925353 n=1 Tax=Gordionus sp. m RMFG-2023 TaxID=3053472 RepID=UPI0030DF3F83
MSSRDYDSDAHKRSNTHDYYQTSRDDQDGGHVGDRDKSKAYNVSKNVTSQVLKAQKVAEDYYGDAKKQANEAIDHLKQNETVSLVQRKLKEGNNRIFNVMDHYSDYGYRTIRKSVPFLNLPPDQPMAFSMALAGLALAIILIPLICSLVYWNHHRTLHHYAYTLNDIDLDALKKYWGDSHYLDTASHNMEHLTSNVKNLPKHSKLVRELGLLYRKWHGYNKKSKIYQTLDKVSDPVYSGMHRISSGLADRLALAPPKHKPIFFPYLLALIAGLGGLFALLKYGNCLLSIILKKSIVIPPDTVQIYGLPAGRNIPSLSPYVLKLETYLRMAKIPYKIDFSGIPSTEGKNPWITYNGVDIPDSQGSIEYLKKKCGAEDLDRDLSPKEKTVSNALRVFTEEELKWPMIMYRMVYSSLNQLMDQMYVPAWMRHIWIPLRVILFIKPKYKSRAKEAGLLNKGSRYVYSKGVKDIQSLSDYLGNKQYMMGEKPTEVDCTIFGMLAEYLWTFPEDNILRTKFNTDWSNLGAYCNRIKDKFWPDWNDRIRTGKHVTSSR